VKELKRNYHLWIGGVMALLLMMLAVAGPHLPFVDSKLEPQRLLFPQGGGVMKAPFPPSEQFPLGSDRDGRDMLSMLVLGARETLLLILGITLIRYLIAVPLGLLGYKNKGFLSVLIHGWNQLFSSLPVIFMAILLLSLPLFLVYNENRFYWVIAIIALVDVGRVSYVVQQQAHQLSKKPFMEAGITLGVRPFGMLKNYYLTNLAPEIATNFCIDIGRVALLIGQLAIFKIFVSQEFVQTAYGMMELVNTSLEWGTIIKDARRDVLKAFWIPFFPALALAYTIFTFNILGEGLRKYFNRHMA